MLLETACKVVPNEKFAISIPFNKRITRNTLKQKGHCLRPNSSVGLSAVPITQGLRIQFPNVNLLSTRKRLSFL